MQKQIQQLIEWHKAFDVPFNEKPVYCIPPNIVTLRRRIMEEEVKEWASAAEHQMLLEERIKELADILYTVFGTIITEGMQDYIEAAFDAVHTSNMSKLGADGKPFKRADGKVLKGENYKEPELGWVGINMETAASEDGCFAVTDKTK